MNRDSLIAWVTLVFSFVLLAVLLAVTQLISLLAARRTLGQFVFGFAVVDAAGAPASRARLFARWLVAWSIPVLFPVLYLLGTGAGSEDATFTSFLSPYLPLAIYPLVALFIGVAAAIVHPTRGLHDQLTGCWLVRR